MSLLVDNLSVSSQVHSVVQVNPQIYVVLNCLHLFILDETAFGLLLVLLKSTVLFCLCLR